MIAVKLENVCAKYHTIKKEILVIKNLNLEVYDKEFLTIIGPSGCGKSTLLSLISSLIKPSYGKINKKTKTTGYMLQKDYLLDWRTIRQNVILGLEIKNKLTKNNVKYTIKLLEKYGLGEFLNFYPHQLSGGMRQKVALIRTLATNPEILLLDEPFSALDFQTKTIISEEVKEIIKNEQKTAILVSHDIQEAICLSDRIAILSERPSFIKRILNMDFGDKNLSIHEKRKHKNFNEYFDIIWNELNNNE